MVVLSPSRVGLGVCSVGGVALGCYAYSKRRQQPPVIVVGGGVMGLSTSLALAKAGCSVTLIDARHPIRGSWGATRGSHVRIEDAVLLKMGLFSMKHWLSLQDAFSKTGSMEDTLFYKKTGAMMAGPAEAINGVSAVVSKELAGHRESEHEVLLPHDAAKRFPQLRLGDSERLFYSAHGYTMLVPTCMACLEWAAAAAGAVLREDTVVSIDRTLKLVHMESGESLPYSQLVITGGPWTNKLLDAAGLSGLPIIVSNEQTVELKPKAGAPSHDWNDFPLFTWSEAGFKGKNKSGGCRYFYTTPMVPLTGSGQQHGVKIGYHRQGALLDTPDFLVTDQGRGMAKHLPHDRKEFSKAQQDGLDEYAWSMVQDFVKEKMPHLDASAPSGYMRCLYQMTPDMNMMVGAHPADDSVLLACGFSGSGFQFAPAVADYIAAEVLQHNPTDLHVQMIEKFSPARFERLRAQRHRTHWVREVVRARNRAQS